MIPRHSTKKHIVLLTDCLADLAGGAEKQIYELARGLNKNLYDVHVVSLDCSGKAPRELIESTGSKLHVFRVVRVYGLSGLIQGIRFWHFLRKNRIDVLLTYHFSSDMWGTFWGHGAGVNMIISNRRDMGFWRNKLHIQAYRWLNPWVHKIVVVSKSIKDMVMRDEGVEAQRIEVIYNGVHLPPKTHQDLQDLRHSLDLDINDTVIIHVANLKPVKGHKYLLEALSEIVKQRSHVKLMLVGKDELNGELQQMAQRLGIADKVLFLGKRGDISNLLRIADICVLPSLSEGMSNSILEYMAASKPVIATNVGGNPELIQNGVNGLLVEKEDTQQLKDALWLLINDAEKGWEMGAAGYALAKREFSMSAMFKRYEHLFHGVKVLHLISSGGLFGAERVVLNLATKTDGITTFIGAIHNHHNPHLEIIDEARNLGLNTVVFESKGRLDFKTIHRVQKFIRDYKIDILHTHNYKSDIIGFLAAKTTGIQWVATNHLWHSRDEKMRFYEGIDAFLLKFAHKVIGVSSAIKEDMMQRHLKAERLEVIDNGVPVEKFDRLSQRGRLRSLLRVAAHDCLVMIVGRLEIEKGHEIFLKAAAEVVQHVPHVKFLIVGDGPLMDHLKRLTQDLNLSDLVFFTGILEDMPSVYAAGDIMVNASYTEGLPMTILEAMASHLPIVASDVGSVGTVIQNGDNGLLLKPGDPQTLAAAIINLVKDPCKRALLSEKAYQDVCTRFSDTHMARKYKQVYEDILSK